MYTQTEKVNIEPKSYLPVFRISQNDVGRTLKAHLVSDEGTITIPAGATVTMAGIKPSGLGYTVTGTFEGSDVTFETNATMTDEAGQIESEIRIVDGETLIGTTNVVLNVEPNPHPDDTTDGQREPLVNEITALLNQITAQADRTEEYSSKVLNMTVSAHESEEPTVTKTEGEVVNLDFGLPRGAKGERGEKGEQGEAGKDGKDGIDGKDGKDGINGVTPDFSIGTVTTLEPTESASVTLTGTEEEPVLNFGIPRGAKGEQGDVSLSDLEKVMVTDTANGAIASFPDGSDLLPALSLVANIVPKQSGSGTPSPENVREISGWESVETSVCGVNQWDEEWELGYYSGTTGLPVLEDYNQQIRSKNFISVRPNTTYFINTPVLFRVLQYDADKNFIRADNKTQSALTTEGNCHYLHINSFASPFYGLTYNHDISINYPSTDHDYHAYTATTHTTELGRTVYGGTVDLVKGTLTVTHGYQLFDSSVPCLSVTTNFGTGFNRALYKTLDNVVKREAEAPLYSDKFSHTTAYTLGLYEGNVNNNGILCLGVPDTITTREEMNAWAGQNPFVIVYELATPTTYQLTPQTINTLAGVNNVWVDSGDVTIEYYADTKLYIDKKLGGN